MDLTRDKSAADYQFRRMCVFNGLGWLFSSDALTPRIVDEMLYDLGHGSSSTDAYVDWLIERFGD